MDLSNTFAECNSMSLTADSAFPSTVVNLFALPTITQLYVDLQRWTLPLSDSGILLKPLVVPLKEQTSSVSGLKKKGGKSAKADEVNESDAGLQKKTAKLCIPSQTMELLPGFKTIFGARRHAKLNVGKIAYTLLLSATGTPKGSWSLLEGFTGADSTPVLVPFDEQAYMRILFQHFGG